MSDDPDFEYLIVDSTIVRAHQHAAGAKKGGSEDQAIGRSRGGLSTKIHMAVRGLGCPVRFTLTAGQKGDAPQATALIEGLPAEVVMADTALRRRSLATSHRRQGGTRRHPQQPITCAQISARQTSLCPAPPNRMLLLKAQAIPPRRNPLRKDRPQLPRRSHSCRHRLMDAISVHIT
jgi:Transposase DDE domain